MFGLNDSKVDEISLSRLKELGFNWKKRKEVICLSGNSATEYMRVPNTDNVVLMVKNCIYCFEREVFEHPEFECSALARIIEVKSNIVDVVILPTTVRCPSTVSIGIKRKRIDTEYRYFILEG